MDSEFKFIAENLRRDIEASLFSVGLLCRVFGRGKSEGSIASKLEKSPGKYAVGFNLVQDCIGIRVVVYFIEDTEVVAEILKKKYGFIAESSNVDMPGSDNFSVVRHNLVFRVDGDYVPDINRAIRGRPIDTTFEVQIRSVLSEGWHEVEHDLRYKCKPFWEGQDDLSRVLNGVVATLETAEWSMARILDELAFRHYKRRQWVAMLHSKLRMRAAPSVSAEIVSACDGSPSIAKNLFRIDRNHVIKILAGLTPRLPPTLDNAVYIWNLSKLKDPVVDALVPTLVREIFDQASDRPA